MTSPSGDDARENDQQKLALIRRGIRSIRSELSELSFRVLCMRNLEHRTVPEVAQMLGITTAEVRYRHCRALAKLKRRIAALSVEATAPSTRDSQPTSLFDVMAASADHP
jgi:DNA-directed RNA polymerase specialized sigma subunit